MMYGMSSILVIILFFLIPAFLFIILLKCARCGFICFLISFSFGLFVLVVFYHILRWDIVGIPFRSVALIIFTGAGLGILATVHRQAFFISVRDRPFVTLPVMVIVAGALPLGLWSGGGCGGGFVGVELSSPLPEARVFVARGEWAGGVSGLLFPSDPARRYALELTVLSSEGRRADGVMPLSLSAYRIYGASVAAPCTGEVVATHGGETDQPGGERGRGMGNYVALACGEATVVLSRLQQNILVAAGEWVAVGDRVGRAGNSGSGWEPSLRLHAVRGRVSDEKTLFEEGEALPLSVSGRVLRRNDVLSP